MVWNCKESCQADCCGVVSLSKEVFEKNKHLAQVKVKELMDFPDNKFYPTTEDMKCIFLNRKISKCLIYDLRPKICVDYGRISELPCPFIKFNGNPRNPKQVKHYQRKINHDVDDFLRKKV